MVVAHDIVNFSPQKDLNWLFFDLNSYFASVEQQDRPELRHKPIVVVPSDTDSTCAIAASYEAKAYGIKTGTKIYEAKKMCPDLICVLARHDIYVDYHHRIFDEVARHIPITKVCSIDEAACRLMDNERDLERAVEIAKQIKQGLKENIGAYIKCSIGLAPNAFLAKVATDMQKPDGLVILKADVYHHKLFTLKLRDLCGIGSNIERRLNGAGITTIEQFWNTPSKHIRKIWGGVGGETFWYKLHGYEIPDKATQKSVVGHSRVLDPVFRDSDKALPMALQLTTKACTRLRRSALYAGKFSLSVRTTSGGAWACDTSFPATQDNFIVTKALHDMWAQMQVETRKHPLKKISVSLYDFYKPEEMTLDLFDVVDRDLKVSKQTSQLSEAMDVLNKKFGGNTVNLGMCPKTSSGYVGTKIAFTRVPKKEEFME
ncbi:MAG: impB/mucB/samB family protein [Alphaproteobacteria bacterium]|nr:impB/mucB/samB family protein [Alphaproteobacteria bacterium]